MDLYHLETTGVLGASGKPLVAPFLSYFGSGLEELSVRLIFSRIILILGIFLLFKLMQSIFNRNIVFVVPKEFGHT